MPLFSYNGRAFKFCLVNLPDDVNREITKMILDNGGEIVDVGDPPIINFTVPDNYIPGRVMYDVEFIKDCVRWGELGDLHKYKLGPREAYDGCIMSIFMYENPSCIYRYVNNPCLRKNICPFCGSRNVASDILDITDSPVSSQKYSGAGKVITSEKSHNKGGDTAAKCLKSTTEKRLSHLEDKTEVSPKLKKLRTNGNASSQEASSIYETAQDLVNYSPDSNLSLTQATQNRIDELHTDTESGTSIIAIQEAKATDQLDSESQRSLKKSVDRVKHKSHLDAPEIIHMSSDSEPDRSWNSEKENSPSKSRFRYKISHLPDVELIQVPNTSPKEDENHAEDDQNKNEVESDRSIASRLRRQEQGKREFGEPSVSNCKRNALMSRRRNISAEIIEEENEKSKSKIRIKTEYKNDLNNRDERQSSPLINPFSVSYISATKRSEVSSEDESSGLNNGKSYGRRGGKEKSEKLRKGKKKTGKSRTRREHSESGSSSGSDTDILVIDENEKGKKPTKRKLYTSPKSPFCGRKSNNFNDDPNKSDDTSASGISKTRNPINKPKGKSKLLKCNASSVDGNADSKSNKDPSPIEDSTGSLTDPEGIFTNALNNETTRVLRPRKEMPNTSSIISDDDLDDDDDEAARLKNDKSSIKKDRNDDNDSDRSVNTWELEVSDDSEASDFAKIKKANNNSVQSHSRCELDIEHQKNGKPIPKDPSLKEWLTRAKRKAQSMEAPQKRNFAKWEKWRMLIFLIEENLIEHAKGLDAWQYMTRQIDCGQRTKMSLNNHFLKYILPQIEEFRLPKDIERKFLTLRNTKTH